MYYLWRFFIHKLIRIPNVWSMRTRMREDADKDGPSGLTSRMNKISKLNSWPWCILIKILQHKDFLHDITDRIIIRISLVLKPNIGRSVDKQEFSLISLWRALCNVDLDNLIEFHWASQNEIEQILLINGLGQAFIIIIYVWDFLSNICFRKWDSVTNPKNQNHHQVFRIFEWLLFP